MTDTYTSAQGTRDGCAASRHDTYSAYQSAKCRCLQAREDWRLYNKRRREGRAPVRRFNPIGVTRRVEALMAIGHTLATIGARADGMGRREVRRAAHGAKTYVTAKTFHAIDKAYRELWSVPGASIRTRRWAERLGYAPPLAWDDGAIDDPAATPVNGYRRTKHQRKRQSTVVDEIALDLVDGGKLPFGRLVTAEQVELYRRYRGKASEKVLSTRWRVSGSRIRQIAALADAA